MGTYGFDVTALPGCNGESWDVSGVSAVGSREDAVVAGCRIVLLKTEDMVLAWELADPTPLRVSPGGDSLSSV
jgi:hypothetical protein